MVEKVFVGVKKVKVPSGPFYFLEMVFRKFEVTSGLVIWAKVTLFPLPSASHLQNENNSSLFGKALSHSPSLHPLGSLMRSETHWWMMLEECKVLVLLVPVILPQSKIVTGLHVAVESLFSFSCELHRGIHGHKFCPSEQCLQADADRRLTHFLFPIFIFIFCLTSEP